MTAARRPSDLPDEPGGPDRHHAEAIEREPYSDVSLLGVLTALLRNWRLVWMLPVAAAVVVAAFVLLQPEQFTARGAFVSSAAQDPMDRLGGLAERFGLAPLSGDVSHSPRFYADLLESPTLRERAVSATYRVGPSDGAEAVDSATLVELLDARGETPALRRVDAVDRLDDLVSIRTDLETGIVSVDVTTRWPEVSRQVAARLIELVNEFNLETRRSRASREREFLAGRVQEARQELQATENALESFLEQNRRIANSPELQFQRDRLEREVTLRRGLYTRLAEALEDARIEQVRNTPVVTIVEEPVSPVRPDRRRAAVKAGVGFALGGMLALMIVAVREYVRASAQAAPAEYNELRNMWRKRKPVRLFARWRR